MLVLFVHKSFPGQYRHLARHLAADPANRVLFLTSEAGGSLPGVEKRLFAPHRPAGADTHPYVRPFEEAALLGQAALKACLALRREGLEPDVICAHAGFGPGLFLRDAFPRARLIGYFEWYYAAEGADADFLLGPAGPDLACTLRVRNAALLQELAACDRGICPTAFQKSRFPREFQDKLTCLHDGVDTDVFRPADTAPAGSGTGPDTGLHLPGLTLPPGTPLLTYATRGMDLYRGFPQAVTAGVELLQRRPDLHMVVAGSDTTPYGPRRADGQSHRQAILQDLQGHDLSRLHFVGTLAPEQYRHLLQCATVHLYLTVPFVLSWSLLDAMSCGAAIVGSDTAPVREVITHGRQGLLADFHDPRALAASAAELLDKPDLRRRLGAAARRRVESRFALKTLLPRQLALLQPPRLRPGAAEQGLAGFA